MSDRVNINVGDGEQIKPDGAYLNDLREARSAQDLADAARTLRERAQALAYNPSSGQYEPTTPAASTTEQSREFTRVQTIGGREFTFTAPDQTTLQHHIETAKAVAAEFEAGQARDENGRFVERGGLVDDGGAEIARQTELELKFRRGEISVKEYITESGTVGQWLQDQGVSIEDLQATAQERQFADYSQEWEQATAAFLAGPGGDWPGGNANKTNLQNALVALNLMDADDKVGALVTAYEYMKQHEALIPYEQTTPAATAAVNKALNESSPEELLDVWKKSQQGAGFGSAAEANARFIESFRRKG